MIKVNKKAMRQIHDVACPTWQKKIITLVNLQPFDDTIDLTQSQVDEMFREATEIQRTILVNIFGEQEKGFNFISDTIDFRVDGIKVFGSSLDGGTTSFIGLPVVSTFMGGFWLNPKYDWKIEDNYIIPTRKK
jgi:hypothetical protein